MADVPLTFTQAYNGSRIVLMMGKHEIAAVFPPSQDKAISQVWNWGFWLGSRGSEWTGGHSKTELAAKNAVLAKARDWLRDAGCGG